MDRERLIDKYLEGSLTAQEKAQLLNELSEDPQFGEEFIIQLTEGSLLAEVSRQEQISRQQKKRSVRSATRTGPRTRRHSNASITTFSPTPQRKNPLIYIAFAMAASVAVMAIVLLGLYMNRTATPHQLAVSSVRGTVDITSSEGTRSLVAGERISQGDILTTSRLGAAVIQYMNDGTTIILEPDCKLQIAGSLESPGKKIRVVTGTATFDVAKQDKRWPFLVETPHSLSTVIGTEFKLSVTDQLTLIQMKEGNVNFHDTATQSNRIVATGQTAEAGVQTVEYALSLVNEKRQIIDAASQLKDKMTIRTNELGFGEYDVQIKAPRHIAKIQVNLEYKSLDNHKWTAMERIIAERPFFVFNESQRLFPGSYRLTISAIASDSALVPFVTHFDVDASAPQTKRPIEGFDLIDCIRNRPIDQFSPMRDNCIIKLSRLTSRDLTIRLRNTDSVNRVMFQMFRETPRGINNIYNHVENHVPFYLYEDLHGFGKPNVPRSGVFEPGTYILYVTSSSTPLGRDNSTYTRCIRFRVEK